MTRGRPQRLVVVATANLGKLDEIGRLLDGLALRLQPLSAFPEVRLPPEGHDYEANAVGKAKAAAAGTGLPALADDSGLEVDALGGAPGPGSARYGGPELDDRARVAKLVAALRDVPEARRGARFVCLAALASADGATWTARGECVGRILRAPRGEAGFGYDPIFVAEGEEGSMAELPAAHKNRISHRARAFHQLVPALRRLLASPA